MRGGRGGGQHRQSVLGGSPVQSLECLRYPRHDMGEVSIVYPRDDRALITIERPGTLNSLDMATLKGSHRGGGPADAQGRGPSREGSGVLVRG